MSPEKEADFIIGMVLALLSLLQAAWVFILRWFGMQIKENREAIGHCHARNDKYFIPRNECERTHRNVEKSLDEIKEGVKAVRERLDDFLKAERRK